jgi:tRNA nucleotidyltransferase/poly(A) polymerase
LNPSNLAQFASLLNQRFHLTKLLALFTEQDQPVIAGGAVRDFLLGRRFHDLDISTRNDPTSAARRFARDIGGKWFWLDHERRQSRVLLKNGEGELCFDFTPWRAETLEGDLRSRDFTINAISVQPDGTGGLFLKDVTGGLDDLISRRLQVCSDNALADDPLRILRGLRLAVQLGLSISPELLGQMAQHAPLLRHSAGERLANELQLLFAADPQRENLLQLQESGVLAELGVRVQADVLIELSAEWSDWARQIAGLDDAHGRRFQMRVTGTDTLPGLLKFARLLDRGCDSGQRRKLLNRLRCSRGRARLLEYFWDVFASSHVWPGGWPEQPRARLRRLEELAPHTETVLLALWLFLGRKVEELEVVDELLELAAKNLVNGRLEDLLSGRELLQLLKLEPGVAVGRYQKLLRREEYSGRVDSRKEALEYLAKRTDKEIDKVIP